MKNVIEYEVAFSSSQSRIAGIENLNMEVKDYINEGFQPINDLVVVNTGAYFSFFQTMVKYDESSSRF